MRSIEFGEATAGVEDWDVVSFDGVNSSVSTDLSQVDSISVRQRVLGERLLMLTELRVSLELLRVIR